MSYHMPVAWMPEHVTTVTLRGVEYVVGVFVERDEDRVTRQVGYIRLANRWHDAIETLGSQFLNELDAQLAVEFAAEAAA